MFARADESRRSEDSRWLSVSTQASPSRAGLRRKLMFHGLRVPTAKPGLLFYVMVDSVAATIDLIVASGGEIVQPINGDGA